MTTPGSTAQTTYDVFISHKSEYKRWVEVLAQNLHNCGYNVFLDVWELVPGRSLVDGLYQGLRQSRAGVLVVTPEAWESGWVREEYHQMMAQKTGRGFPIIPVVVGHEVPDIPFLQDVLWVDFRSQHSYHEAFYRLLCAIDNRAPGPEVHLPGELLLPPALRGETTPHQDELTFIEHLFELFYSQQAVLLFGQADRGQSTMKSHLLARAQHQFGARNVVHLVPPCNPHANATEYYAVLAQQCEVAERSTSPERLLYDLEEKLRADGSLFMLVSGLENTWDEGRYALAGIFRSLNERHTSRYRLLICGGEKLAELYFRGGVLSFLSHATVQTWPELTVADVRRMTAQEAAGRTIDDTTAQALLAVSGGHPRLLQHCLSGGPLAPGSDAAAWRASLLTAPFVWHLFTPFMHDVDRQQRLCQLLAHQDVGRNVPYLSDELLRHLYWKNLLKSSPDGQRLIWRCEALRLAGLHVLGCAGMG